MSTLFTFRRIFNKAFNITDIDERDELLHPTLSDGDEYSRRERPCFFKGTENSIVERSTIGLASQDPPFDWVKKRQSIVDAFF